MAVEKVRLKTLILVKFAVEVLAGLGFALFAGTLFVFLLGAPLDFCRTLRFSDVWCSYIRHGDRLLANSRRTGKHGGEGVDHSNASL